MKTKIFFFIALVIAVTFCSCGEKEPVVIDIDAISSDIASVYEGAHIELAPLEGEAADAHLGLTGLYEKIHAESSITVTSDEFVVMEALDEASAEKAYKILDSYRKERIALFSSYASEQVPKLENALLEREGNYVIFVVAENITEAKDIWNRYKG